MILAYKLGFDHTWEVPHHFLDEHSRSARSVPRCGSWGSREQPLLGDWMPAELPLIGELPFNQAERERGRGNGGVATAFIRERVATSFSSSSSSFRASASPLPPFIVRLRQRKLDLNAVLEDGEQEEVLSALRRMATAFGGVSQLAAEAELNATTLYRTLSPKGNPALKSLTALLRALGMQLAVRPLPRKRVA